MGVATFVYINDNKDRYPDEDTTGNWWFRRAPGERTPNDPAALPEVYGLAAVLARSTHTIARSEIWICPAQPDWMLACRNTYAFSLSPRLKYTKASLLKSAKEPWVWDNYLYLPGLTGFRGRFSGYQLPKAQQVIPHVRAYDTKGVNQLYMDGHAAGRYEAD